MMADTIFYASVFLFAATSWIAFMDYQDRSLYWETWVTAAMVTGAFAVFMLLWIFGWIWFTVTAVAVILIAVFAGGTIGMVLLWKNATQHLRRGNR